MGQEVVVGFLKTSPPFYFHKKGSKGKKSFEDCVPIETCH